MPTINKKTKRNYNPKRERSDIDRKKRMEVYNSKAWKELREAKRMANPLCEVCEMEQKITLSTDVHHLQTFTRFVGAERDALAYDFDNLISLCDNCHWEIHHGKLRGCTSKEEIKSRLESLKETEE